jgi:hypothetical protein
LGRFDRGQFLEDVWLLVLRIGDEIAFFNEIILFILLSRYNWRERNGIIEKKLLIHNMEVV